MSSYTPAFGDVIYSGATAVTEDLSRVGGFIAGCGQAALLVVLNAVKGEGTSPSDVTALIREAVNGNLTTGRLASSGQASPANLEALSVQHGVTLQSGDYHQQLTQYAGTKPILLGVSNARAFGGSDANVSGHYITVVGRKANGDYIVSDPNTIESRAGKFVTYTLAQIQASIPFYSAVPIGPILGAGVALPSLVNIQLPDWLNSIGSRISAVATAYGSWFDPVRILKLALGVFLIMSVATMLLFEGLFKAARQLLNVSGDTAAKAATIAKVLPK